MIRETIGFLMISLVVVISVLIWISVRKRRNKQESLIAVPVEPTAPGDMSTFYVSTVFESSPLDRIWAHGFAMRGNAQLGVDATGISVHRTGERSFLIPTASIAALEKATATIDKGVERDGLCAIRWSLDETGVVTNFRFSNPTIRKEFEQKVSQLIGAQIG